MSSFTDLLARAVDGTYELERELGHGTSAVVYLARSIKHDRYVALKVLRPEMAALVGGSRFLREIEIAAKLTHPHILPLLDSNEADGLLYLVTPYIEGESLRELIDRDGRLSESEALRLAIEVAGALQYAHTRGVVHRDIKPENILLQDGRAIVADFGISLSVGQVARKRLTESGLVIGTPWYMSPEQVSGAEAIDARSDIYSLGCVLYELLTGNPPFSGENPQVVLVRQLSAEAPRLRQQLPSASAALEACLAKALEKDPEKRFATAREFATALEQPLAMARGHRPALRRHRRYLPWLIVAALVVIGAIGYALASRTRLHERDWLVVADFEGPATDPGLTAAFREMVTAELNRSHFVQALSRQQLNATLRDAGMAETTTVNSDLARELAFRSAVHGVVSGTIGTKTPGRYHLNVRVVDADRGNDIISIEDESDADGLMPAFAKLADRLRAGLGEKRSAIEADRPLLNITTPSLPAYRKYVDALEMKQRGNITGSNRELEQAIVIDTAFASAWALLGLNFIEQRNLDSARSAFAEALRRPSRMSDANRYRLLGDAAYAFDYDLEAAVRNYETYLREYPNSIGGRSNYGLYLSLLGRREEALAAFTRANSENPFGPANGQPTILNEVAELITLGRRDRAEAVARDLTGPFAIYAGIQLANASGDLAKAQRVASDSAAVRASVGWLRVEALTTLASVSAAYGRFEDADHRLTLASDSATGAERRWYLNLRSLLGVVSNRRFTEHGPVLLADTAPGALLTRALASLPDTTLVRRNLALLRARPRADSARLGQGMPVLQGLVDEAEGNWPDMIARLAPLARRGENDALNLDRLPSIWSRWLVAEAYERQGRSDSALTYLRLAIADTGIASGHLAVRALVLPFAKRKLARNLESMGKRDEAAKEWRALLDSFKNADRDGAQISAEARIALARKP